MVYFVLYHYTYNFYSYYLYLYFLQNCTYYTNIIYFSPQIWYNLLYSVENEGIFMNNEIKRFYEYLIENTNVQEKLKKNLKIIKTQKELENFMKLEIMPLAKKNNFNLNLNDLMNHEKKSLQHLTNEDLLNVAGGISPKSLILSGGIFSLVLLGSGAINGNTAHAALPMNLVQKSTNNLEKSKPIILSNKNDKSVENNQPSQLDLKPEPTKVQMAQSKIKQEPTKSQTTQSEFKQEPTKSQTTQSGFKPEVTEVQVAQSEFKPEPIQNQATQSELKQELTPEQMPQNVIMNSSDTLDNTSSAKNEVNNTDMTYIAEALNLLDPYIYNISGTTERFRFFDGSKTQIAVGRSLGDNVPAWEFNKDQGEGSANFMRCLFPSSAGTLNSDGGVASLPSFTNDCAPTPETIAHIAAYIHNHVRRENSSLKKLVNKYWQDYSFGVKLLDFIEGYRPKPKPGSKREDNNIYTYIEKNSNLIDRIKNSIKLRNWDKVHELKNTQELINLVKDISTFNNYLKSVPSHFSNKEKNTEYKTFINTYLYLLKNATYMVEKQEILNENPTDNQFLPKYTTEKMLMCYFIHNFNTENDVNQFYNEAKKIILINNNNNDKLSLQNSLERLANVKNLLYKISQTKDCPYTEPLVENGSCQFVEFTTSNTLKFNSNTFADCADTVVRHIINLLSYHDSNGWNFILGNLNDYDKSFENSVNDVYNAINSNSEIDKKPIKDRLLQFFYYQATKSGTTSASQGNRTFWNYAISNMDKDTQYLYKIRYNNKGNELKCGWINCLKLTYNIIYTLKSSDQSFNQPLADAKSKIDDLDKNFRDKKDYQTLKTKLDQAIIATFGIITKIQISDDNDKTEKFEVNENDIFTKIYISKCSNNGDIIFTFPITHRIGHASINFSPNTTTPFNDTPEDKKLEDFLKEDSIAQFLSNIFNISCNSKLEFNCIFGPGINISKDAKKTNNTTFYNNYNTLRFLKESLGEANNAWRIDQSLSLFSININNISNINVKSKNNSIVSLSQFIFDSYIRTRDQFILFLTINPLFGTLSQKAENYIKSSNTFNFINENNNKIIFRINVDETVSILYLVSSNNLVIPKEILVDNKSYIVSEILGTINKNVKTVTFQEGFKKLTIGESAFAYCNQLTTFIVPESVVSLSIEFNSFNNCEKLKTFSMPDSISSLNIKSNAFFNCLLLDKFNIPKHVTSLHIESYAFSKCSSLHEFNFGNQIVSLTIGHGCFNNCVSLEKFNVPDSVTSLSIINEAFNGCVFLETFTVSRATEFLSIGNWAFAYCESLISFNIPIDSKINSLIIKKGAFFQCGLLEKFDIPKSVTSLIIQEDAFKSCQTLKSFNIYSNLEYLYIDNSAFSGCSNLNTFNLPVSLSYIYIGNNAFINNVRLKDFNIPNNTKIHSMFIGNNAFYQCESLTKFNIPNSVTSLNISDGAFNQCTLLTTFGIPETVLELHIGFLSFANCSSLKNLTVPKSVTSLRFNTFAFDNCEAVNTFNIPDSVKCLTFTGNIISAYSAPKIFNIPSSVTSLTITSFAFMYCKQLTVFTIPNSVKHLCIDKGAFFNCSNLVKFNIPKTVSQLSIGHNSFIGCSNLEEFNVPTAISSLTIGSEAFYDCYNLKKFNFSDSITSLTIGNGAFYNCRSLNNLQISNNLTFLTIGDNAFYNCSSLTEFNILNSTFSTSLSIGNNAFKQCLSLQEFNILAYTKHLFINTSAFDSCTSLQSFNVFGIIESLTINEKAFDHCLLLKKFNISNHVNLQSLSIENEAFNCCPFIEEFNVPNSIVSLSIGQKAFYSCLLLKQISIPASVKFLHIDSLAFSDDTIIYYQ